MGEGFRSSSLGADFLWGLLAVIVLLFIRLMYDAWGKD